MTGLEKRIFQNGEFNHFLWLRYFDENFDIWTQDSQKVKELFNCINSLYPTIKINMGYSATEINFFGVIVTKAGNKLETDLCYKPTDMHQYLHAQSCHNDVHNGSIAYGQL